MEDIQTGNFNTKSFNFHRLRQPLLYVVCLIVVLAAVALLAIVVHNNSKRETSICTQKTNLPLLNQAAMDISNKNIAALTNDASKVAALQNYKNDPNCLYVLFQSSIEVGDVNNAQNYLSMLEKIFPKNGLYPAFDIQNVSVLKAGLGNEEATIKTVDSGTIYLSNPKYAKK